jgi:hypothetical protein
MTSCFSLVPARYNGGMWHSQPPWDALSLLLCSSSDGRSVCAHLHALNRVHLTYDLGPGTYVRATASPRG